MHSLNYATGFSVDEFIRTEAPMTFGLFNDEHTVRKDLDSLFSFPTEHREAMPFYVFREHEAKSIAHTSERVYAALCSAVEWLAVNRDRVPEFFGREFCERYPEFIEYAFYTFENDHEALYGRFDMAVDVDSGMVSGVYEFNGDTPVMLFESTILQNWLTERVNKTSLVPFEQSNTYFPETQAALRKVLKPDADGELAAGILLHAEYIEDAATCETLFQLLDGSGLCTTLIDHIDNVGFDPEAVDESPWSVTDKPMGNLFALQPWEEIVASCYDDVIVNWRDWANKVRMFEPAWRWFLANKGIWAVATYLMETNKWYWGEYRYLPILPTYMSPDRFTKDRQPFVQKPLVGRLSNNITIHQGDGDVLFASDGAYEGEPCVYQAYCPPGQLEGRNNFIVGQWMAADASTDEPLVMQAASLCIREFDKPVLDIGNERFIPHLIETIPTTQTSRWSLDKFL